MYYRISKDVLNEVLSVLAKLSYESVHQVFAKLQADVKPIAEESMEDHARQVVADQE